MTPDQIEMTKKYKKSDVSMSGFYVVEDPNDKNHCYVTKLCKIDLGDAVTPQMMKSLTKSRIEVLIKLRSYVKAI